MIDLKRDEAEEAMLILASPLDWEVIVEGDEYRAPSGGGCYEVVCNPDTGFWYAGFGDDPFGITLTCHSLATARKACCYHKVFGKWE